MFQLLNALVGVVLFGLAIAFAPTSRTSQIENGGGSFSASANFQADFAASPVSSALVAIYGIYALVAFVPALAVTVRRLHDQNRSGWWYPALAIPSVIPLLGVVPAIVLLVFLLLPGTSGANRFGPDPKDPYGEEVFA